MELTSIQFSIDDITTMFNEADFESKSHKLRDGVVFAWEVSQVCVKKARDGYLMLNIKLDAKDGDNRTMGVQYENIPLPVSYLGAQPGDWAKRMFISKMMPFFPDRAAFDTKQVDPVTGKTVYSKCGVPVDYALAKKDMTLAFSNLAVDLAKTYHAEAKDDQPVDVVPELKGRLLYGSLATTSKGEKSYTNLHKLSAAAPIGADVVYDRSIAFV